MDKLTCLIVAAGIMVPCSALSQTTVSLDTDNTTLVLETVSGKAPGILYYGSSFDSAVAAATLASAGFKSSPAYPAFGLSGEVEPAVSITQADGNRTLDLRVIAVEESDWEGGRTLVITSRDSYYPVTVRNCFRSFSREDVIETWAEIVNGNTSSRKSPGTIVLNRYMSGTLPLRVGNVWTTTQYGSWGDESRLVCEPLTRGIRMVKNVDGVRNSQTSRGEVMISLDGKPREDSGRVIGAALEWGGNYQLEFRCANSDYASFLAGVCPDNAEYYLEAGETFRTPALAYSFSDEGLSGVSRNFHRWGRKWRMRHGDVERKVLLNSWEGVYLDVSEPAMDNMMADIASMGGELFVMDDGWFGGKYARKKDNSGLGDWFPDREKLPHGLGWLVRQAGSHGVDFGIWIEPEMTNSLSELYEAHPDWVLHAANRTPVYTRGGTQLVLDMSNPAVQDFVFSVVDNIVSDNPGITYIKWDANMTMMEYGSLYLKHQSHLAVEYWRGLESTLDRIRAKYPDLTIQTCASGGGRANWGVLPWFDEFWVSDNTDALQRIFIQWGSSYFFPAIAMASHISVVPNHQVHRTTSLKFRCDVAMSGRLGMEIQPADMTQWEKDFCRGAIADYKRIRPIVQFGDIYRLVSPYDGLGVASLMYVAQDKSRAAFYWWRLENLYDSRYPRVRMRGLDPDRQYRVSELNRIDKRPMACEGKSFSGRFLMENGIEIAPVVHDVEGMPKSDWASRVLLLESE
ncbi:MAG: alpha-galactosidase [Bacteroidales bacterium]|nr:alpha-galactosidase [Bacteroidales bacterium]